MVNSPNLSQVLRHGILMRNSFDFKKFKVAQWFPGHMGKGVNQVQKRLKDVDCVIEVHDARIPLSGRNPFYAKDISKMKPHILILNKVDLIDYKETKNILNYFKEQDQRILFTNCKNPNSKSIKKLVPLVSQVVKESERYHRSEAKDYSVMITGVPNVGKSSLINALRTKHLGKGRATQVGAAPGVTKSVLERIKISQDPLVYVLDTPGILTPRIGSVEVGLKLALVNTIKEHLVGEDIISDYLLYRLNCEGNHKYVDLLNLDEPTDDIQKLLVVYALKNEMMLKIRRYVSGGGLDTVPDTIRAAQKFLTAFRTGQLGPLKLDSFHSDTLKS
ncbi:UNVERIFIED_CONTAM: hypothetical protein GTU68_016334 [Idotea baltica]|nr:hypothetical protein [Idotea baltica]